MSLPKGRQEINGGIRIRYIWEHVSQVYAINNLGAQVMKLQGAIFLLLAVRVFQPAHSSELHLAFPSVHTGISLLPSPWSFHCFERMIQRFAVQPVLSFMYLFFLPLLFSIQGNPLDSMIQFSCKLFHVPIAYILKDINIFENNCNYAKTTPNLLRV